MASLSSLSSPGEPEIEHIGCRIIGTHREGRTVWFTFELTFKELYWNLDLRYSQLFSLYKEIAAKDELPVDATIVFPPKKIANTNPAFIETRRSMLEAWVAAVLRTDESFGNAELLDLIMLPVTALVWVRKYHRMTASDRSANRVEQGGMLWVDMQYAQAPGKADTSMSDDLLMALADPSTQPDLAAIAMASVPSAMHYVKSKVCESLTSSILTSDNYADPTPFFAGDTASTVVGLHEIWFNAAGPVVDPALPTFVPGMSRRKRMMRRQSTRRVKIVPPAVYTVEIIRPRDARGVLIPFQVNLAKETDGEYCWLSSVGSNDALSDAGLLAGDNLLALGRHSFFQASQHAVLEALLEAPETFSLCMSRALEIHTINIGKFIRTSNEPLPMGATLVSDEDLHVGEIVHKFRKVHPEGAGARAGLKANDILLEVDGASTKQFSHKELKLSLQTTAADMFLVARAKPPTRLAHETPKPDQMVKLGASDVISEGFMCPLCMKDLGTMENLASHFEDEHADPSNEQTLSPTTPTAATPKQPRQSQQQKRQTFSERRAQHRRPKERQQHQKQPDFRSPQVAVNPGMARLLAQPQRVRANSTTSTSSHGSTPSVHGAAPSFHDVNHSPAVAPAPPARKVPPVEQVRFCRFCGLPFVGWNNTQKQDHLSNCTRKQGSPGTGPAVPSASAARQQPPPPMPGGQRGEPSPHLAAQPRQFFDGSGERHFEQDFSQAAAPALVQRVRAMSFRSSPKSSPRTTPKVPKPGSAQPRGPVQDRWWVARKAEKAVLKEVAAAQCGDFLVRPRSRDRVLIVLNDFGVTRSLLVLIQPDGQAQMAGRDTAIHPSLYHLIDALRHTPQRSSTHVGSNFQLRLPAGRLGQLYQPG